LDLESSEHEQTRRISIDLPTKLIDKFDQLRKEWGLRARGAVLERLLEIVLSDEQPNTPPYDDNNNTTNELQSDKTLNIDNIYNGDTALVLVHNDNNISLLHTDESNTINSEPESYATYKKNTIDLPGFVRQRSQQLKTSLSTKSTYNKFEDPLISSVKETEVLEALKSAKNHWVSLYGQPPKDNVVEAAMTWLAIDIWNQIDGTENLPFTWNASNKLMSKYLSSWEIRKPNFERVLVTVGVLEDPFGTDTLSKRMPSLIRRFVNKFKKSQKVTSFQTIESTMTVHGALKLLDLPTKAGSSLTLNKIRDSFKQKALTLHPDAGGSTEAMRRLNEAYNLLKELYRQKRS
tara:strand:+ start:1849 stop:2892 length:1044 start_codon:yes stop_codon:yes gene_type:complete